MDDIKNAYEQLATIATQLLEYAQKNRTKEGVRLANSLLADNLKFYQKYTVDIEKDERKERLERERRDNPTSAQTRSQGQGIASYKHVRGGSISSFVERMHDNINIKSIVKYNKSAYVISI